MTDIGAKPFDAINLSQRRVERKLHRLRIRQRYIGEGGDDGSGRPIAAYVGHSSGVVGGKRRIEG